MINVLLHFDHGLGDCVQFTVVLKHLSRYRPDWQVDVCCPAFKAGVLEGLCNKVYHREKELPKIGYYKIASRVSWFVNRNNYVDRPNTKITSCLADCFGLGWDREIGAYECPLPEQAIAHADSYLSLIGCTPEVDERYSAVAIHYQGESMRHMKNLTDEQALAICDEVEKCGATPVIVDIDGTSRITDKDRRPRYTCANAVELAALIHRCEAFIGIDSGPAKLASCTHTPTLVLWTEHHPAYYHDPAENTMHALRANGVRGPAGDFFRENYNFVEYENDHEMIDVAAKTFVRECLMNTGWLEGHLPRMSRNGHR